MSVAWEQFPIFAGLEQVALDFLHERVLELRAQPGEVIVREGEAGNRMFLISEGEVRVVKHSGVGDAELARLREGNFFGEMCIMETLPRVASVLAVTPVRLHSLSSLKLYELFDKMPRQYAILLLNIARDISRRLRKLDEVFAGTH